MIKFYPAGARLMRTATLFPAQAEVACYFSNKSRRDCTNESVASV